MLTENLIVLKGKGVDISKIDFKDYLFDCDRDNLYKLLKDDGKVISSHLINNFVPYSERKVFKDKFDLYDLPMYLDPYSHNYYTSGYCYTKKDVNKK